MGIKEIHYHEARLVSTAQFENARVEVGVTYSVEQSEVAETVLDTAKDFVREALAARIVEIMDKSDRGVEDERKAQITRKFALQKTVRKRDGDC